MTADLEFKDQTKTFHLTKSTKELVCPFYAVVSPFLRFEDTWKFQDYEDAARIAQIGSTFVKEFKIEVRIYEEKNQDIGLLVSAFEQGEMAQGVQVSFLQNSTPPASSIRRQLGKTWAKVVEQHAADIRNMKVKAAGLPLSPEENFALTLKEQYLQSFLGQMEANMDKRFYSALKWTYVDYAGYKNKSEQAKNEVKPALLNVTESTIRKYLLEAYDVIANIAVRENWKLLDSARATLDHIIALEASRERRRQMEELEKKPKKPRKKREGTPEPKGDSQQLSLFDEAV